MRRLKLVCAQLIITITLLLPGGLTLAPQAAYADDPRAAICTGSGGTWTGGTCSNGSGRTVGGTLQKVSDLLIFLVGAISVIMIIIGALRYTLSGGDQAGVNSAKNTILYAIVGLVVAFSAYGIVHFVLIRFKII